MTDRSRTLALVATLLVAAVAGVGLAPAVGAHGAASGPAPAVQSADCQYPFTLQDASGTNVTLESAPDDVVVLGPSAAQTAWEIDAADQVVGLDRFSTYLEGADGAEVISGGIGAVDYEATIALEPDLIVVGGNGYNSSVTAEFRESTEIPVVQLADAASIEEIYGVVETMGTVLDRCDEAADTAAEMRQRVDVVETAVANASETPTVFYPLGFGYTAGPDSFVGDVFATAGGQNLVDPGEFDSGYPQVSEEWIVNRSEEVDWLVATYNPAFGGDASDPMALLPRSDAVNQTRAYREGNVVAVNANHLSQPAPRIVRALETIATALHPDAYAAANATTTAAPSTTSTTAIPTEPGTGAFTTDPTTTAGGGDGGSMPGFGPAIAVASAMLAGAGLLVRRRD